MSFQEPEGDDEGPGLGAVGVFNLRIGPGSAGQEIGPVELVRGFFAGNHPGSMIFYVGPFDEARVRRSCLTPIS